MDITMSIAAASMSMSAAQIQQSVDIALLKKTMNAEEMAANSLLQMAESVPARMPEPGRLLDMLI